MTQPTGIPITTTEKNKSVKKTRIEFMRRASACDENRRARG
jgi:hypothetical protein